MLLKSGGVWLSSLGRFLLFSGLEETFHAFNSPHLAPAVLVVLASVEPSIVRDVHVAKLLRLIWQVFD